MFICPFCSATSEMIRKPGGRAAFAACKTCLNPVVVKFRNGVYEANAIAMLADMRQAIAQNSIGGDLLQKLPENVERLPVLPQIAHRIMSLVQDPDSSASDLAEVIGQDQVIALKVLQLANSAYYSGLSEIADLSAACARLGMKTVASSVQAIVASQLYTNKNPQNQAVMQNLWRHALGTAYCASDIASMLAEPHSDVFFVAGLVHDIGKLLIFDIVSNNRVSSTRALLDSPELLQEVMDGYHALVGLHIVQHWGLPAEFGVTTFCHDKLDAVPDTGWLTLVHTVALANAIANACGYGLGKKNVSLLGLASSKFLNIKDTRLASLRVDLEDKLAPLLQIIGQS
ncbi:MAG: HDOD domain-containing protein [Candidatus Hydrogenedentes bacterium]|nr:HDOD domain-containing protein [Candidatus Hydrogenedentota bacterium]